MNPVQSTEMQQLYGHSIHAGGWPKLGWQQADADATQEHQDDACLVDEALPGLYS